MMMPTRFPVICQMISELQASDRVPAIGFIDQSELLEIWHQLDADNQALLAEMAQLMVKVINPPRSVKTL